MIVCPSFFVHDAHQFHPGIILRTGATHAPALPHSHVPEHGRATWPTLYITLNLYLSIFLTFSSLLLPFLFYFFFYSVFFLILFPSVFIFILFVVVICHYTAARCVIHFWLINLQGQFIVIAMKWNSVSTAKEEEEEKERENSYIMMIYCSFPIFFFWLSSVFILSPMVCAIIT